MKRKKNRLAPNFETQGRTQRLVLWFSFNLIYPRLIAQVANNSEMPMGTDKNTPTKACSL